MVLPGFSPWVRKIPWGREWQATPVFLPGEFQGLRSLVGCSPWGCKESEMTEWLSFILICKYVKKFWFKSIMICLMSITQLCLTLCDSMDYTKPGFPVHHQLPELAQTDVHCIGDAIQSSHPLLSPSLPAFSLSKYQGLFQWISSLHQVPKVLEFQHQHQSFQWIFRTDFL